MAITLTTLPQMDETEATAAALAKNAFYVDNELDGFLVSKIGQTDAYFETSMPLAREVEYDGATNLKKNQFAIISALANIEAANQPLVSFVDRWEEQYTKMFG